MGYKLITPIATEPITLTEVKRHLRLDLDDTSEDDQLNKWIISAREYGETYTRRAFGTQTRELTLNNFPCASYIEIPKPPLQAITSITYKDSNGTVKTMPDTDYIVDIDNEPGKVVLGYSKSWPVFTPYPINAVRIRFVCGYNGDIPSCFKDAMLFHVGLFYKYRDEAIPKDHIDTVNRIYYPNRIPQL
ncbi:MAG TPA: head-tail connector protein [Pseudobacteroides sp.]|uniref:head-tail connector protein n=1 Tax=Pseudobacteroides sp. TaxID=1968840 RepID=UPI002F92917B